MLFSRDLFTWRRPVLPISDIPVCLKEFAAQFRKVFSHPAQKKHFEEVLAGLIVAENPTVAGIQQKLLNETEYDSLQNFMTDSLISLRTKILRQRQSSLAELHTQQIIDVC